MEDGSHQSPHRRHSYIHHGHVDIILVIVMFLKSVQKLNEIDKNEEPTLSNENPTRLTTPLLSKATGHSVSFPKFWLSSFFFF
jgi:hypothetical protein